MPAVVIVFAGVAANASSDDCVAADTSSDDCLCLQVLQLMPAVMTVFAGVAADASSDDCLCLQVLQLMPAVMIVCDCRCCS